MKKRKRKKIKSIKNIIKSQDHNLSKKINNHKINQKILMLIVKFNKKIKLIFKDQNQRIRNRLQLKNKMEMKYFRVNKKVNKNKKLI